MTSGATSRVAATRRRLKALSGHIAAWVTDYIEPVALGDRGYLQELVSEAVYAALRDWTWRQGQDERR